MLKSVAPTKEALRAALLEIDPKKVEIRVEPVAFDSQGLQDEYAKQIEWKRRAWELTPEESKSLDETHNTALGNELDPCLVNRLYHSDALVIQLAKTLNGGEVTVEGICQLNAQIQMSGTNPERDSKTESTAGVLRGKGQEVTLPGDISLSKGEEVEDRLRAFVADYNTRLREVGTEAEDNVATAVDLHQCLVQIHPFKNGNGRVARTLLYNVLIKAGLPMVRIDPKSRTYQALSGMALKHQIPYQQQLVRHVMELQLAQLE
jgi:prophage maintenance system killer protein